MFTKKLSKHTKKSEIQLGRQYIIRINTKYVLYYVLWIIQLDLSCIISRPCVKIIYNIIQNNRLAVAAFDGSSGDTGRNPSSARPHKASSSMVGLASWRPYGRGDASRLALLSPSRVGPRAPKLPSIRQQGPLARSEPFGT